MSETLCSAHTASGCPDLSAPLANKKPNPPTMKAGIGRAEDRPTHAASLTPIRSGQRPNRKTKRVGCRCWTLRVARALRVKAPPFGTRRPESHSNVGGVNFPSNGWDRFGGCLQETCPTRPHERKTRLIGLYCGKGSALASKPSAAVTTGLDQNARVWAFSLHVTASEQLRIPFSGGRTSVHP